MANAICKGLKSGQYLLPIYVMKLIQPLPSITVKIQKMLQNKGGRIFCGDNTGQFISVSTFEMDRKMRQYALDLQDTVSLVKLSTGELVSEDAVYHLKYCRSLFHKVWDENMKTPVYGMALAELVSFIEDTRGGSELIPVFILSKL
ncbi:hypothetical protein MAR_024132 [Mya arenaria]|uniref:Uncharacterized protein n=1 Tax=Mya arenaria TaxID=6604 RepID=A0ABY7DQR5_MYAAR|nr:hypothetical protein MAR_024132 [Mya arenaria]